MATCGVLPACVADVGISRSEEKTCEISQIKEISVELLWICQPILPVWIMQMEMLHVIAEALTAETQTQQGSGLHIDGFQLPAVAVREKYLLHYETCTHLYL